MTFAKYILLFFAFTCNAQFLPMIGHTAGATNVTKIGVLPEVYLTNGLFAVWHLDNTNDSRCVDSWGTNHLYFRSAANVSLTNGVISNAGYVSAADNAGELTNNAGGMTFTTFSISMWYSPKIKGVRGSVYCGTNSTTRSRTSQCSWGIASSGTAIRFAITNSLIDLSSTTFNVDEFTHWVFVYSNDVGRVWCYKNGALAQTATAGPIATSIEPTSFSIYGQDDSGAKDEVAIWSRGLTEQEAAYLYQYRNWRDYPKQYR
jgi:hypothetical protein